MVVTKVRRLSNPRKKRRNPKAKRRLSDKQIRHFGTKAQRSALKRRRSAARSIPKRKAAKRNPKRTARRNPAMITLGILNPRKAGTMATKRKRRAKKNPTVARRRRRNTVTAKRRVTRPRRNTNIVVMGKRRNPPRRRSSARRRNPMPGGGGRNTLELVLGGLVGAMAAKSVSNMSFVTSLGGGGPIVRAVVAAATGYGLGMATEKFLKMRSLAEGVTLGGLLEGGAIVVSTYLPSVGSQLGLGAIIPGYVNPPVNPVTYRPPVQMIPARGAGVAGLRGINAAFGGAL